MSCEINRVVGGKSNRRFTERVITMPVTCLLCRVLWPVVLQHRHLLPAYPSDPETDITLGDLMKRPNS